MKFIHQIILGWICVLTLLGEGLTGQAQQVWIVQPQGPYATPADALAVAQAGDTIEVHGGTYSGPLLISQSVQLIGVDWPVLEGNNAGTVVKITAPDVRVTGWVIRNSGGSLDQENSGIAVEAPRAIIEGNRLEETLFGIYLREAHGSVIRGNRIRGKALELPRRGDAIRIWSSRDVLVEQNIVNAGRDVVLWYSEGLHVRRNTVSGGRYGLHFMYCDDALIEENQLIDNSVGAFLMYSRRLHFRRNLLAYNRGPSGYGIGLKDLDDGRIESNLIVDNRVGIFVDNSPREIESAMDYFDNAIAYNDIGVLILPSVRRNVYRNNSFIDNQQQVHIAGGGRLQDNLWEANFWSDYAGYDVEGDGVGDVPYRSQRLFEDLLGRYPALQLFRYSPATQALEFAARAVPFIRPQPKLQDPQPRMAASFPAGVPTPDLPRSRSLGWMALGLLIVGAGLMGASYRRGFRHQAAAEETASHAATPVGETSGSADETPAIAVAHLTKRFGSLKAVDNLSFTVAPGEVVALWGANGAGKTTVLRCLLGILAFEGWVVVEGYNVQRSGREARRRIGFVPQELAFHEDLSVWETLHFYARLKKASPAQIPGWLERLSLEDHATKPVGALSGGMKQRLALAIALLGDPPILLLDEPTSSLDVRSRGGFLDLLHALKAAGKTMVFSSHRLEELSVLADRVLVLEQGRLVADNPPAAPYLGSGERVRMRLIVAPAQIESAMDVLRAHHIEASPTDSAILVHAAPHTHGYLAWLLAEAGIPIESLQLEGDDASP